MSVYYPTTAEWSDVLVPSDVLTDLIPSLINQDSHKLWAIALGNRQDYLRAGHEAGVPLRKAQSLQVLRLESNAQTGDIFWYVPPTGSGRIYIFELGSTVTIDDDRNFIRNLNGTGTWKNLCPLAEEDVVESVILTPAYPTLTTRNGVSYINSSPHKQNPIFLIGEIAGGNDWRTITNQSTLNVFTNSVTWPDAARYPEVDATIGTTPFKFTLNMDVKIEFQDVLATDMSLSVINTINREDIYAFEDIPLHSIVEGVRIGPIGPVQYNFHQTFNKNTGTGGLPGSPELTGFNLITKIFHSGTNNQLSYRFNYITFETMDSIS